MHISLIRKQQAGVNYNSCCYVRYGGKIIDLGIDCDVSKTMLEHKVQVSWLLSNNSLIVNKMYDENIDSSRFSDHNIDWIDVECWKFIIFLS